MFRTLFICLSLLMSSSAWALPIVEVQTSMGKITLELDQEKAPKTVANFVKHAEAGSYNNTIFHRLIDGFMIQGGGFSKTMQEKSKAPTIENEAKNGLKNLRGTIAMARTPDPHSASTQFFINLKDNDFLNFTSDKDARTWGYAVFGKVTQGMEVVDKIAKVATGSQNGHDNVPKEPIVILSVKVKPEPK